MMTSLRVHFLRVGIRISKVVRPLQIKDHSCMCRGGLQQAMCSSKNYLWNQNAAIQEKTCTQRSSFQMVISEMGKTGAGVESP